MNTKFKVLLLITTWVLPLVVSAQSADDHIGALQHDWAIANYELSGDAQIIAYEKLIESSNSAVAGNPKSAELLVWNGIIKSAFAGVKGGVGALSYAKEAKKSLEESMKIDDRALDGSAYASLGVLYFKVPGWPLGFGNDKKAAEFLQKALVLNPDGIDSNYFYADYLLEQKDYASAEKYLLKAQQAAPRNDRPIADAGRRQEISAALGRVYKHKGSTG